LGVFALTNVADPWACGAHRDGYGPALFATALSSTAPVIVGAVLIGVAIACARKRIMVGARREGDGLRPDVARWCGLRVQMQGQRA
jgi:hypothetical protein